MIIKELESDGGFVAWNQCQKWKHLFAAGSFIPQSNSNQYVLSIFSFDTLDKHSKAPVCMGQTAVEHAIKCICWCAFHPEEFPYGLICAGHEDGAVRFYDAAAIIEGWAQSKQSQQQEDCPLMTNAGLVSEQSLYEGPVTSIKANPFKPHLIATGGQEVLIINIEKNLSEPDVFNPGQPNLHESALICEVSWNKKVPHILASADQNGLVVVWDLKTNKAIFNFQNASCQECRQVELDWSPEIPTQVGVAFDDSRSSALQIWDLRNPQGPVMLLEDTLQPGHQQGVSALAWCTADGKLVLTAGAEDAKVSCWNYQSGELVCTQQFAQRIVDVQWSRLPSIYSVTLESGAVALCQLQCSLCSNFAEQDLQYQQQYAPRWLQPLSGCSLGGVSGNVAFFTEQMAAEIRIKNVYEEADKVRDKKAAKFQNAFQKQQQLVKDLQALVNSSANDGGLLQFAEWKAGQLKNIDQLEAQLWRIHKSLVVAATGQWDLSNSAVQTELLSALGFSKNDLIKKAEDYTGKTHRVKKEDDNLGQQQMVAGQAGRNIHSNNPSLINSSGQGTSKLRKPNNTQFCNIDDAEGFFEDLAKKSIKQQELMLQQQQKQSTSGSGVHKRSLQQQQMQDSGHQQQGDEVFAMEQVSHNINWEAGVERIIKENLIVGNYEGAIDCALKCGRTAEALLIASSQNKDLFESTMQSFFVASTDPFIKNVFKCFIEKKVAEQAQNYDLKSWRECAGLVVTTSTNFEQVCTLVNVIGQRFLDEKNDEDSALACFTFARNFDRIADIYFARIQKQRPRSQQRALLLVESAQKLLAMHHAVQLGNNNRGGANINNNKQQYQQQQKVVNAKFERMVHEIAMLLVDCNEVVLAYQLLMECGRRLIHNAVLADLLYNSHDFLAGFERPNFPFKMLNVKPQQMQSQQGGATGHGIPTSATGQQRGNNNPNFNNNKQAGQQQQQSQQWQQQQSGPQQHQAKHGNNIPPFGASSQLSNASTTTTNTTNNNSSIQQQQSQPPLATFKQPPPNNNNNLVRPQPPPINKQQQTIPPFGGSGAGGLQQQQQQQQPMTTQNTDANFANNSNPNPSNAKPQFGQKMLSPPPIMGPPPIKTDKPAINPSLQQQSEAMLQSESQSTASSTVGGKREPPRNLYAPPPQLTGGAQGSNVRPPIFQQQQQQQPMEPFPSVNQPQNQYYNSNKGNVNNFEEQKTQPPPNMANMANMGNMGTGSFHATQPQQQQIPPPMTNSKKPVEVVKPVLLPPTQQGKTPIPQNQQYGPPLTVSPPPQNNANLLKQTQQFPPQQQQQIQPPVLNNNNRFSGGNNMPQQQQQQQFQQQQQQFFGDNNQLQQQQQQANSPPRSLNPNPPQQGRLPPPQQQQFNSNISNVNSQNKGFVGNTSPDSFSEEEIQYIQRVFESQIPRLQQIERNFKRQQELENNIRALYKLLQAGQLQLSTAKLVVKLSQEIEQQDIQGALNTHQQISKVDWENNKIWLVPLKRIITGK